MTSPFIPNFVGKVDPQVNKSIGDLWARVGQLESKIEAPGPGPSPLDYSDISRQLSIAGKAPLNIAGLIGVASQVQKSKATTITTGTLPGPSDPISQSGALVLFNGLLYFYDTTTNPGTWKAVGATGVVLQDTHANRLANYSASSYAIGTLIWETDRGVLYLNQGTYGASHWEYILGTEYAVVANQPSDLGVNDVNYTFFATDTGEEFYWTGTVWNRQTELVLYRKSRYSFGGTAVTTTDFAVYGGLTTNSTFTLPKASTNGFQIVVLKNLIGSSITALLTLTPFAGDSIEGASSYVLSQGQSVVIQSDGGTNWIILSNHNIFEPSNRYAFGASAVTAADFSIYGGITVSCSFTLPQASTVLKHMLMITNVPTSTAGTIITVSPFAGDLIENRATWILFPGQAIIIQSDNGTNWFVLGSFGETTPSRYVFASDTVTNLDGTVIIAIGSAASIAMPLVFNVPQQIFYLKNVATSTANATINRAGGDVFEGATSLTLTPGQGVILQSDNGTTWIKLAEVGSSGGITQLTGEVTAGPGSGSQAATVVKIPPGVTLTGTPSTGQVPTATGTTTATWQSPAASPGAWVSFTPTTGNLSSVSSDSFWTQHGKDIGFRLAVSGTSNGSLPTATLPIGPVSVNMTLAVQIATGGATVPGTVTISGSTMTFHIYNNTAFTNGVSYSIGAQGFYDTP